MLFNSIDFGIFFPIFFILYWFVTNKNLKLQNSLIVLASYIFYGCWDWRFLGLIILSTCIDYTIGISLAKEKNKQKRKFLLFFSVVSNLGILFFFKYLNFFIENFVNAFSIFGYSLNISYLNIVLPIGISFYTFQTLSYTIDVYKEEIKPTTNFITFSAFVSFFPQLVAGPIERAKNFLPQFESERHFDLKKAKDGLKQVLWGFFKKMVIADNCAIYVDDFFGNPEAYSGSTLLLGAILFTVQIYCDFSGYSDIAIGTSRLFGFNLKKNFAFPYFSRNIVEFWRRWHISLTTWFKDYFYIPIGGSRGNKWFQLRNTFLIFIVIGFWHGAHWKFILYGFINACHFVPYIIMGKSKKYTDVIAKGRFIPNFQELKGVIITFSFLVIVRILFRADSLTIAMKYLSIIFSKSLFTIPDFANSKNALFLIILIIIFFFIEWLSRDSNHGLEKIGDVISKPYRWGIYYILIFSIFYFYGEQQQFIYFQF